MSMTSSEICALVTGASGGIGRAAAVELARRGATVALHCFRNRAGAEATAQAIAAVRPGGGRPATAVLTGDLSRPEQARRVIEEAERALGRIDVLVNNAGDLVARRPLLEMTEVLWREVLDTNLSSVLYCTQAAAAGMIRRRAGVVVNVASLAAWNGGGPGALAYAAAKGAVVSLSKALARELAPHGVRVNCISPGLIDETAFHQRFTPREAFDGIARGIPLGRPGRPDEVARVIAFLAGEESSYLVGETVEVNGGLHMR